METKNKIEFESVQEIVDANNNFLSKEKAKLGFEHKSIQYAGDELI